jgi:hypothetical protein
MQQKSTLHTTTIQSLSSAASRGHTCRIDLAHLATMKTAAVQNTQLF